MKRWSQATGAFGSSAAVLSKMLLNFSLRFTGCFKLAQIACMICSILFSSKDESFLMRFSSPHSFSRSLWMLSFILIRLHRSTAFLRIKRVFSVWRSLGGFPSGLMIMVTSNFSSPNVVARLISRGVDTLSTASFSSNVHSSVIVSPSKPSCL